MPVFDFLKQPQKTGAAKRLEEIAVDKIIPNPNQPRTAFDDESLNELAKSIQQVGLIQPLLVRKSDDGTYELVAGERRLRAVKLLGFIKVPCIVQTDLDTEDSALMALIENLQRENLHYMEEAQCYAALIENYSLTQEQLAVRLGKSQSGIANKLRLLKLSQTVTTALAENGLTERHAREVLRLGSEEAQLKMVQTVKDKNLSVKETEKLVSRELDSMYDSKTSGARPRPAIVRVMRDYRLFMNTINSAVGQLREAGLTVDIEQSDRDDGVDISISVTNPLTGK